MKFLVDRAISRSKDDTLHRDIFAEVVVNGLNAWDRNLGSLVIAIYGSWGCGKTSVKNLIFNKMIADGKFHIVAFNPWHWRTSEQITNHFFKEIDIAIQTISPKTETPLKRLKRLNAWRRWTYAMKAAGYLGSAFSGPTGWLLYLFNALEMTMNFVKHIGKILINLGQSSQTLEENYRNEQNNKDAVEALATEVDQLLGSLPKPILIAIDDVDRLGGNEIRMLFQLIKANSDFPNLAFLVLCQREIVEHSLAELLPSDLQKQFPVGREFLDKIVHVGLTLPELSFDQARKFLIARLGTVLTEANLPDGTTLTNIAELVGLYCTNMRNIIRYTSGLAFQLAVFRKENDLLVNAEDLALLEVLRIYEPELFKAIRQKKWMSWTLAKVSDK